MTKIPKYIQEMMSRSRFALGYGSPGYTIEISKYTIQTNVRTLEKEIVRLQKWIERIMPDNEFDIPTMEINSIPKKTHYCNQYAVVTIYDPIMKYLEKYIGENYEI